MSVQIGSEYETRTPVRGSDSQWGTVVRPCIVVEEVPLVVGNQPLYVIQHEDGTMGKAWARALWLRS